MPIEAQRLVTRFEGDEKPLDRTFQSVERKTQQHLSKVEHLYRGTQGRLSTLGSSMASSGGLLPGLSNISEIIQGIPQIGRLAGGLVRPLTDAAEEGIRLNMVLETAQIGFEGIAGSADKAKAHIVALQEFGKRSPFRFEGLLEASRFMTAFGFSLDEQIPKLTIWGNAIAASGELSAEKIHDVVRAFGQMRLAGRVNAQDMNQLTNANIPGWELLAKAIGKTVEQTRKLSEAGKLSGPAAVEAITAMMKIDPRFKDMMKRMEATGAGRLSAAQDVLQFAQGRATETLTRDISETLGAALQKENLVGQIAGTINLAIAPVSGLIKTAAISVLGGGLTSGFIEGIQAGRDAVKQAVGDFAMDGIIGTAKSWLGIQSPSKVFYGMGLMSAEGFNLGFAEGLNSFDDIVERFLGRIEGKLTRAQKKSAENLAKLMEREPGFKDKLIRGARERGINPDHLLNVMAIETAGTFNPAVTNPYGYTGLIQFGAAAAKDLGTTTKALRAMSATDQLDFVFRYLDQHLKDLIGKVEITQAQLYAAVGHGSASRDDQAVMFRGGTKAYALNAASWDVNRDKMIQQWEFGVAALNKLGAGVNFTVNNSPVTATNPVPVAVVMWPMMGGSTSAAGRGRRAPKYSVGVSFDESSTQLADPFQRMMARQSPLSTDMSAALMTRLIPRAITDTRTLSAANNEAAKAIQEHILGVGQWAKLVIRQSESLRERLEALRDTLPNLREEVTDIFANLPQGIGNIFGDAVRQWDGTFKGFLMSLAQGVQQTLADIAAQLASSAITKLLVSLGLSALGGISGGGKGWGDFKLPSIGTRASGGPIEALKPYYVHKDELILPMASGYVFNQRDTAKLTRNRETVVHNHYSIQLPPDSRGNYTSPKSKRQLAESVIAAIEASRT